MPLSACLVPYMYEHLTAYRYGYCPFLSTTLREQSSNLGISISESEPKSVNVYPSVSLNEFLA